MPTKMIDIPYHTEFMPLNLDEDNLKAVITPLVMESSGTDERETVAEALRNPIGAPRLRNLAAGKKKILLITCDHTRAMPSKLTLPLILDEIRAGAPDAQIDIIIATGTHRATTEEEQRVMFGDGVVDNESIYVHDCTREDDMVKICKLPSGATFNVNRMATECDLLIAEGFIEPHFFAGFSGGRKSVMPGIASLETVNVNHSYMALANPYATTGVLDDNPVHVDMVAAARAVGLAFILNVALDADKKIVAAFSGDMEKAHLKGCEFVSSYAKRPAIKGDIVVTGNGGYPLDQNLYQASKAASTAAACAGEDGVIILVSGCIDGFGGEYFSELMLSGKTYDIDKKLSAIEPEKTIPEQWNVQIFTRIMLKHKIIFVTTNISRELLEKANFIPAETMDEALGIAYSIKGKNAKVVVVPDGVSVIATM